MQEFDASLEPLEYAFFLEAASQVDAPRPGLSARATIVSLLQRSAKAAHAAHTTYNCRRRSRGLRMQHTLLPKLANCPGRPDLTSSCYRRFM